MKTVASWLDSESLAELGLLAERESVVVDGCATKHAVIQALLGSGKALQPVADAPPSALHSGAECGAQGPTSMSGTAAGQAAASSSAAAGDASADNGVQETPVASQLKPETKATAPARATEAKGDGGDKPVSRRSPDSAAATTSSEGIRTKKGQGVSGVERQSTPRPGHGSSGEAGKWRGTPAGRTSPKLGKSATTPRNAAVLSGTGSFFVTPEQISPCELRCKCSRVHSNGRSSPPSARSPELAETATTPTGRAASTAARVPASARQPTTSTRLRDSSNIRAATYGVDNPASRKPPEPAKLATTPRGTAASTGTRFFFSAKQHSTTTCHRSNKNDRMAAIGRSNPSSTTPPNPAKEATTPRGTTALTATRVPSSARQSTTPIPTNDRTTARAVAIRRGNPASTTSPHPTKTVTTPRNTAVTTGDRVFFGPRQPTTPTSLRAARAAKNAKISPDSTPSPLPAKAAVTTPRGTAASTSTRVRSSARQPTTPTGRRDNHKDRAVAIRRGNPASKTSPHPAKTATTPRDRAASTGNRVFFGPRQPTTPTSLRAARAAKNAKISPALTPSPHPAKTVTTPRGAAASASARVPSSERQLTTPTGRRGNNNDRAVTIRRGNPASTTSPHPAKTATSPRDRAASTGNRVFFGPGQPTKPTSLRAARAAKNAKISPGSTPSPHPAKTVTTPRGAAASASTRVPSSERQPTTPTGRGGNNNDRAATDRESRPSTSSSEPTGAAKTPRSVSGTTRDRISLVARQAAEGIRRRSLHVRASTNGGGKLASGRSPEPADATASSGISSLLAYTSSSVVASHSAQELSSTSRRGTIEGRHPTAPLSTGAPEDFGSSVEPSPIVPATFEDSLLEALSASELSEMEPAEPGEAAQAAAQTRNRPVQRATSEVAPGPTCAMAEFMLPQIQLLNALQRTVLLNPF